MASSIGIEYGLEVPMLDVFEIKKSSRFDSFFEVFKKNEVVSIDPLILEGLRMFMEEPKKENKKKKSKKTVTWFIDVPYKEKRGKVIKGPISSCLTFDKDIPIM